MNQRVAFPFLTLREPAVSADEWLVALGDADLLPAGDYLPDWDYASSIRLSRTLRINFEQASEQLGVATKDLQLVLVTRIGTGTGRLPRLVVGSDRQPVVPSSTDVSQNLQVSGETLSSVLDVHTEILLAKSPDMKVAITPANVGDRLWSDRQRLRLEGEEPRFPIELANFRELLGDGTAANAPWYLHWSPSDWTRDFHGAVRLYLNSERPEIVKRVEEQDGLILQAILADVMGQIGERLLKETDLMDIVTGREVGSLAAQATAWFSAAWPDRSPAFIRSVLEHRPGDFRATMLALSELHEV